MHKITTASLSERIYPEDKVHVRGFTLAIEPPVDLNPEVVGRVIKNGSLDPEKVKGMGEQAPFSEALLIGSTEDKTVIYARFTESVIEGSHEYAEHRALLVH